MTTRTEPVIQDRVTLDRPAVDRLSWEPFRDRRGAELRGVFLKLLWSDPRGNGYAGLLRLEPGAIMGKHVHRLSVHHIWVIEGSCHVDRDYLSEGSYSYVPVATEHGIDKAGPAGCTLFYLYLRA